MPEKEKKIVLRSETVEGKAGATHYYRYAKIKESGDLEVGSTDSGTAPEGAMGGDSECWIEVPAAVKDDLLLALLEMSFKGKYSPEDEMVKLLKKKNIPYSLHNEVW